MEFTEEQMDAIIKKAVAAALADAGVKPKNVSVKPREVVTDANYPKLTRPTGIGGNGVPGSVGEAVRYAFKGIRWDGSVARVSRAKQGGNPIGALEEGIEWLKSRNIEDAGSLVEFGPEQQGDPFKNVDRNLAIILVLAPPQGLGGILTEEEKLASASSGSGFGASGGTPIDKSDALVARLQSGWTAAEFLDEQWKIGENSSGTPDAGASGNDTPTVLPPAQVPEFIGDSLVKGKRG